MAEEGEEDKSYALFARTGPRRFVFRLRDPGISQGGPHRLARGRHAPPSTARRRVLHVSDATASGLPDQASRVVYRDFLRDLHGRLESDRVSFTAGYSQARYRVVLIASILLGLILVATPLVLLMITGETRALLLLFVGAMLALPLARMVKANAPRPYTPDTPPEELGAADTASALLLHLELDWRSASRLILGIKSPPLRQKPRRAQGCRTA
jgi:hypothetical protein